MSHRYPFEFSHAFLSWVDENLPNSNEYHDQTLDDMSIAQLEGLVTYYRRGYVAHKYCEEFLNWTPAVEDYCVACGKDT